MTPYLQRALAQVPLTGPAEDLLARAAAAGVGQAREELILSGLRAVVLHGLRLGHRDDALDEAVAAGTEALVRAVDRFDPDRGVRLATYAWPWIARAMTPPRRLGEVSTDQRPRVDDALLDGLPRRWAQVLGLRFGFWTADRRGLTRAEVGARLGLTVWQVRQAEGEALSHLRERLGRVSDRAPERGPIPHSSIGRAFDC